MPLMSQKTSLTGGEQLDLGSRGAERDKSPRIKPGRKCSEDTRSGENEGRE